TWDLTAVLWAAHPGHDYFGLSPEGTISLNPKNVTDFVERPGGLHRYLAADHDQIIRVREALVELATSPPRN
ncbi:nucleoside hydrolase, partial [Candidatus Sumerlaeota bacterium]|nr:nucleoside hydrolase [Candidatus Sumerlaeota bacterium]